MLLFIACAIGCLAPAKGQLDAAYSQYMSSQFFINPGYAGVRNSVAANLAVRQQWQGIEGAPKTYSVGVHGPINKTYTSIGGILTVDQLGPISTVAIGFAYSHLLKINDRLFVSAGMSLGVINQNVGLRTLELVNTTDPNFERSISNKMNIDVGVGGFMYTDKLYVGLSIPHVLQTNFADYFGLEVPVLKRHYYLTAGYALHLSDEIAIKPSGLFKVIETGQSSTDINMQLMYRKVFWIGASYRLKTTMAYIVNVQVSKNWSVGYSYDTFSGNKGLLKTTSHEITLNYDSFAFIKKNRKRMFKKKREDESMKSIRYF